MESIKLANNRVIRDRPLRPSEKIAENAINRLYEATKWAQASMVAAQERQERYTNRNRDPALIYKPGDALHPPGRWCRCTGRQYSASHF
jgi:hypothetical protein